MAGDSKKSNWALMMVYTVVLVIGLMISVFVIALYWTVGDINRVKPVAANYQADSQTNKLLLLYPLSTQVVDSARRDQGGLPSNSDKNPTPTVQPSTGTPALDETPLSNATATATGVVQKASPTASKTATPSFTPTFTLTKLLPTSTLTPKPTNTPNKPNPTSTRPPQPTQPLPTATEAPRPTKPPPPTATKDSYPPPRPTDSPPTAYP